jgi:hypothetical protein
MTQTTTRACDVGVEQYIYLAVSSSHVAACRSAVTGNNQSIVCLAALLALRKVAVVFAYNMP